VIEDFNDLLSMDDKRGQVDHPLGLLNGFRSTVMCSGLRDVRLEGYQFMRARGRGIEELVEERLDKALTSHEWIDVFLNCKLQNLIAMIFYHFLIWLCGVPKIMTGLIVMI